MKNIRNTAIINGVETTMLFTPRLFEFKTAGMEFSANDAIKVAGMYADVAYCAALNYWTLTDHDIEEFKLQRIDFHEWAATNPKEFGKTVRIAVEALTNKSLKDLSVDKKEQPASEEIKKKTCPSITQRLKTFLSAIVGCRKGKPDGSH